MKGLSRYLNDLVWDLVYFSTESIKSVEYVEKYISSFYFQVTINFIEFN